MRKYVKSFAAALAALTMTATLLGGCSAGKKAAKAATLNFGIQADIVSLDPAFAYDSNTTPVASQICEGLLAYDSNNKLIDVIAKDWKAVDKLTYVYNIRDDVKFSDGSKLTADDVVFSMNRTKNPATASSESWMYSNVKSITKTGPSQVTVKLSKPDSTWQYVPATSGGMIISQKYYEAHKSNFGKPGGGVLGTGPYVFKKWVTGSEIDLQKNPNYWDKSVKDNGIKNVKFKVITDSATMMTALKTGQVDIAYMSTDVVDQAKSFKKDNVLLNDGYESTMLGFNNQRAPFNDVNVRRAVSSAIDTASITKNIVKYDAPATALPFGTAVSSFDTQSWTSFGKHSPYYKYDLTAAKEYLAKSKYASGFSCDLVVPSGDSGDNSIALVIQQALKQINITVNIKKMPGDDFTSYAYGNKTDKNGKRDYDMLLWTWLSDWPDPAGYLSPLYLSSNMGQGGANWAAYSNKQFDSLMDEQNNTLDPAKRSQLMQKAVSMANSDAAYCVIGYPKDVYILNKNFNFKMSSSWFYNTYIKNFTVN